MNSSKYRTVNGISAIILFILLFFGAFGYSFFSDSLYFSVLKMINAYYSYHDVTFGGIGYYVGFIGAPIFILIANVATNCVASRTVSIISAIINGIAWITVSKKASYFYMDKAFGFYLAVLLCVLIVIMSICAAIEEEPSSYRQYDTDDKPVSTDSDRKEEPVIQEEKKEFLFRDMFYEDGPIIIRKAELIITDSAVKLRISIKNISDKTINIIRLYIKTTNALGEVVDEAFEHMFIDINIAPGNCLRNGEITLSSAFIRKAEVNIDTIMFDDGTKWERNTLELVESENSSFIFSEHEDIIAEFKYAKEIQDYINGLDYQDDEILNDKIKPMLDEYVYVEKNYGNKKEDVIKKIKEIYGVSDSQTNKSGNLVEEPVSTESNVVIANNIEEERLDTEEITNNVSNIEETDNNDIATVDEMSAIGESCNNVETTADEVPTIEENVSTKTEVMACNISNNIATLGGKAENTITERTKKSKTILWGCGIILVVALLSSGITLLVMENCNQSSEEYEEDVDDDFEEDRNEKKAGSLGGIQVINLDEEENYESGNTQNGNAEGNVLDEKTILKKIAGCWTKSDTNFMSFSEEGMYEEGIFYSDYWVSGQVNSITADENGFVINIIIPPYYDEDDEYVEENTFDILVTSNDQYSNSLKVAYSSGISDEYTRAGNTVEEVIEKTINGDTPSDNSNSKQNEELRENASSERDLEHIKYFMYKTKEPKCQFIIPQEFSQNSPDKSDDSIAVNYINSENEVVKIICIKDDGKYKNLKDFPQNDNIQVISDNENYYVTTYLTGDSIGYKAIRHMGNYFVGFEVIYKETSKTYYDEVISDMYSNLRYME